MDTQKSEEQKMKVRMDNLESLKSFINAEFDISKSLGKEAKAYFCTECGGNTMSKGVAESEHKIKEGHKVIRAFKGSGKSGHCYKESALTELGKQVFDYSGIQGYTHHAFLEMVYDINPKPKSDEKKIYYPREKGASCSYCGYIINESSLYCSISCKVNSLEKEKEESTGPEAKNKRKEIVLGGGSEQSMINKAKKNAAVGQESGSGSEEKEKAKNVAPEEKGEGGENVNLELRLCNFN